MERPSIRRIKIRTFKHENGDQRIEVGEFRSVRDLIEYYEYLVKIMERRLMEPEVFEVITKSLFGTNGAIELFRAEKVFKKLMKEK
ncbi:MAG: hypothetical protein QXT73_00670 [Candidatus Methanomethylicaceae archaeon]